MLYVPFLYLFVKAVGLLGSSMEATTSKKASNKAQSSALFFPLFSTFSLADVIKFIKSYRIITLGPSVTVADGCIHNPSISRVLSVLDPLPFLPDHRPSFFYYF